MEQDLSRRQVVQLIALYSGGLVIGCKPKSPSNSSLDTFQPVFQPGHPVNSFI